MQFYVLDTAVFIRIQVFSTMTTRWLVNIYRPFGGDCCLYFSVLHTVALLDAASSPKESETINLQTRRHITGTFHTLCCFDYCYTTSRLKPLKLPAHLVSPNVSTCTYVSAIRATYDLYTLFCCNKYLRKIALCSTLSNGTSSVRSDDNIVFQNKPTDTNNNSSLLIV